MRLEAELGFRSSFNFVPLRYAVSGEVRRTLEQHGFEVGVHGLYHDGQYYRTKGTFLERSTRINQFLKDWKAVGYRAPAMYHKLDLFHNLNIEYDASTFDTDPFEPHAVGAGTIFPFHVIDNGSRRGFIELPYTLPQDFTLFVLMQNTDIEIWKTKLRWIVEQGGMALINTHPDYMSFGRTDNGNESYPAAFYEEFLKHIKEHYAGQYWHALPRELAREWKNRYSIESLRMHPCNQSCNGGLVHAGAANGKMPKAELR